MENSTKNTASPNPWNEYLREYRKRHPEVVKKTRINYARKLLTENGYTVIPPQDTTQGADDKT